MLPLLLTAALAAEPAVEPEPAGENALRRGRKLALVGAVAAPVGAGWIGAGFGLAAVSPDAPADSFEPSFGDGLGMLAAGAGGLALAAAPPFLATGTTVRAIGLRQAGCGGSAVAGWLGIGASAVAAGALYVPVVAPDADVDGARLVAGGAWGASLGAGIVQGVVNRRVEHRCREAGSLTEPPTEPDDGQPE